jgi:hypothetical protein
MYSMYMYPAISVILINLISKKCVHIFKAVTSVHTVRSHLHLKLIIVLHKMILYIFFLNSDIIFSSLNTTLIYNDILSLVPSMML